LKPQFQPSDAHTNVKTENEQICGKCDFPSATPIKNLKARGLLDSTIVIWSGEFGRLPVSQNGTGREHNRNAFSLLTAGGGSSPGTSTALQMTSATKQPKSAFCPRLARHELESARP
jgi:hypothetical protein